MWSHCKMSAVISRMHSLLAVASLSLLDTPSELEHISLSTRSKAVTANDEYEDDNAGVLRWYALLNTLNQYDMDESDDEN